MRLITDVLRDIRRGRVVDAASVELAGVVRDAVATGKAGELTLKIKVTPDKGDPNLIRVTCEVKGKSPRPDLPDGLFFADKEGDLLREDPERVMRFADAAAADEDVDPLTGEVTARSR